MTLFSRHSQKDYALIHFTVHRVLGDVQDEGLTAVRQTVKGGVPDPVFVQASVHSEDNPKAGDLVEKH